MYSLDVAMSTRPFSVGKSKPLVGDERNHQRQQNGCQKDPRDIRSFGQLEEDEHVQTDQRQHNHRQIYRRHHIQQRLFALIGIVHRQFGGSFCPARELLFLHRRGISEPGKNRPVYENDRADEVHRLSGCFKGWMDQNLDRKGQTHRHIDHEQI